MYRKGGYIVARIFGLLAVLLMAALVAIQTPYIQTRLSKVALNQLAAIMDGRVQYDELKVMTSGVLVIRNIVMLDNSPYTEDIYGRGWEPVDTVFRAKTITATVALDGIFKGEGIHLGRVTVEDGLFHMVTEPEGAGNNLSRILKMQPQTGPLEGGPDLFDIKKVRIKNFRFRMNSFNPPLSLTHHDAPHIDFEDLDVTADLTGHNIRMAGGKMYGVLDKAVVHEKSGYQVLDLSGIAEVGLGKALVEDVVIVDPWSDIRLRSFSMTYPWAIAFQDFVHEVMLEGEFQRSRIALQTLSYFAGGAFDRRPTTLDIRRGHARGYVSDMHVDRLVFTETDSGVSATLDGAAIGLPDNNDLKLDLQLKDLQASTSSLSRLATGFTGKRVDFSNIAHGMPVTLQLKANGFLNQLDFAGEMLTSHGSAGFEGQVRNVLDTRHPIEVSAALSAREMDLGRILGTDRFGPVTLYTRAGATLGKGLPDARLDTLYIEKFHALGRDFQQIRVSGSLQGGTVNAFVHSDDPAVGLDLRALADITPRSGENRYRVNGTLSGVDLRALGIENGPVSRVAAGIRTDLVRKGEYFDGQAVLQGVRLKGAGDDMPNLGDIRITASSRGGEQRINLNAPFLEGNFVGSEPVTHFVGDVMDVSAKRDLSALFPQSEEADTVSTEPGRYKADLLFHNTRDLLALLLPGAYIEDNTRVLLGLSDRGWLDASVQSGRLALGSNYLKDVNLTLDNLNETLNAHLVSSELRAGTLAMAQPSITATADHNAFRLGARYDSFAGGAGNAELNLVGQLSRSEDGDLVIRAHPVDSYLTAGEERWDLNETDIVLDGKGIILDRFGLRNGFQSLIVNGGMSRERQDTLTLRMDSFNLALVDQFLPTPLGIEGRMNGRAYIASDVEETLGMLLDFNIDTLRLGGTDAGSFRISSQWNDEGKELGIHLLDRLEGRDILQADGTYSIEDKLLDLKASLHELPLKVAAPFLRSVFSEMGGGISGTLAVKGPAGELSPSSDLRLEDALVRVAITGVSYTLVGPLLIDGSGCHLDGIQVRDDAGGSGSISGGINFEHLRDFNLATRLTFNNLKLVDAEPRASAPFYGLLRASGSASVTGPFNAILVDANVSTAGDGNIHIPTAGKLASSSGNLLVFTEPTRELDAYEQMMAGLEKGAAAASDLQVRGRLNLHPGVKAFVEIDKSTGNVASISGTGTVNLDLRPSRSVFNLIGDYNINEGNYQFVVPGLLSKGFDIQQGSSVKFSGDIMNTALDIKATYGLRTSLDPLLGTETSTRRQVDCGLAITDKLRSPKIDLSIDIPDLDPSIQSLAEIALNTPDKVQKQFVSLLLLGSFLPSESSGVYAQTNLLFSNMTEMMAGQINNILQRLDIPIDVGFGYQEMSTGLNLFDVAVSTQLFDNRVIVGGSFGNRRYSTGSSRGDFVGNLDISVKLDTDGKFRFNIFSHSADEFSSYLDYSQRNGIGFSFQQEYRTFNEFFKNMFSSRATRAEREQEALEREIEQVVLELDKDDLDDEHGQTVPDPDAAR